MALFFSESQILSILNDIIKNESLFPESQILYNWFHIMEADKHTTRYFCDVIEQFHTRLDGCAFDKRYTLTACNEQLKAIHTKPLTNLTSAKEDSE